MMTEARNAPVDQRGITTGNGMTNPHPGKSMFPLHYLNKDATVKWSHAGGCFTKVLL